MHYIKTKKPKEDRCNICGEVSILTWDHVPPKGILIDPDVCANTLFSEMPTASKHMREYQSGIKYRTICQKCNNELLGTNDQFFKQFINDIYKKLIDGVEGEQLNIGSNNYIEIPCKINRVLRAVCGHMLAIKDYYDSSNVDQALRSYVQNDNIKLHGLKVFSWFYPYSTVIIARDMIVNGHLEFTHPSGNLSIINSFPLAFLLSINDESMCNLDDLSAYCTESIDDIVTVRINLDTFILNAPKEYPKSYAWPVDVSDNNYGAAFAIGGKAAVEDSRRAVRKSILKNNETK